MHTLCACACVQPSAICVHGLLYLGHGSFDTAVLKRGTLFDQNSPMPITHIATITRSYDDEVRFDFFCKAALEFMLQTGRQPDILHAHDWQVRAVGYDSVYWQV